MKNIVIEAKKLCKKYKYGEALSNLDISIEKGSIYGLIGQNGAGKTTFFKIIMGLIHQTSGEIYIHGTNIHKKIGSIIETPSYYPNMNVAQNMEMVRLSRGIKGKECINKCLKEVGLEDTGTKKASKLSLGMKQRLAIAMALVSEPEILILDEPTNGLDPIGIVEIRNLLMKINNQRGVTILISSHILSEVYQIASCFGIMKKGKLIEELTRDELSKKAENHLEIKVGDLIKAQGILDAEFKGISYKILQDGRIQIYSQLENAGLINMKLSQNNVIVDSINQVGDDLEKYFIKVSGGAYNA